MDIVFATNNQHKLDEVRKILGDGFNVLSLKDISLFEDIPETGKTLLENAQQKADYVYRRCKYACFADDTGLMVDALNGEPGVYSARYAGEGHDSEANMSKLLKNMVGFENRRACFKTMICLIEKDGATHFFEGRVDGEITHERSGAEGFGYDPIFMPDGYNKTFAELGNDIKNKISHRARATEKLAQYLQKTNNGSTPKSLNGRTESLNGRTESLNGSTPERNNMKALRNIIKLMQS